MPDSREVAVYNSPEKERFELAWRAAQAFAGSTLIPEGMRTRENCMVAIMLADEMGESRLSVMQNLFQVKGRFGWVTSYMTSRARRTGVFTGPVRWHTLSHDPLTVECYADLRHAPTSDSRVSIKIDLKTAEESGWTTYKKDNKTLTHSRWATPVMQEQMLRWRTAAWLIRLYAPECLMGLPTKEELEDTSDREMVDVTPPVAMPKLEEFASQEQPKRRGRPPGSGNVKPAQVEDEPNLDDGQPSVEVYELTNCDGELIHCTANTVEDELLAIFDEARKKNRGADVIEGVIEHNEALVTRLDLHSLNWELNELRGLLTRMRQQEERAKAEPAQKPAVPRRVAPNPAALIPGQAPQQNPEDRPPARSPADVRRPDSGAPAPHGATMPPPGPAPSRVTANQSETQLKSYVVEPVYTRDGGIAYRAWYIGPFFNSLRKSANKEEYALRRAANGELMQAYYDTLAEPALSAAKKELDDIEKGIR